MAIALTVKYMNIFTGVESYYNNKILSVYKMHNREGWSKNVGEKAHHLNPGPIL